MANIYFSDFFDLDRTILGEYGAFDVSLINDLPLFVDPFLLFNSEKPEYQELHNHIINYLKFLRDQSNAGRLTTGNLRAWYQFGEVKQNWFGYSQSGNQGSGLGPTFAEALSRNLTSLFQDFGTERISRGSHLERVILIDSGVGKDNISDFTTCLIKEYLLTYTQQFAIEHLRIDQVREVPVAKVSFNYKTESWQAKSYLLPWFNDDFILLTPKDILTRYDPWINRNELIRDFTQIVAAVDDEQLRAQLNNYFYQQLSLKPDMTKSEAETARKNAVAKTAAQYPAILDYFIKMKEENGDEAEENSRELVSEAQTWFVDQIRHYVTQVLSESGFYQLPVSTHEETRQAAKFMKQVIENQDGYRLFYHSGKAVERESDLQLIFKFLWKASPSDANSEVNNGRGPVDFKISRGSVDKTNVEFKLASNPRLKDNLAKQTAIYEKASGSPATIKVIAYFTESQLARVNRILIELALATNEDIVLIDCRNDNKPSGSKA